MTKIISVTKDDLYEIVSTVYELTSYWESNSIQNLIGLAGEYAVIDYFNNYLYANPKIKFNTKYQNGGDGGYDFKIADATIDVKTIGKDSKINKHFLKTNADILFFVKHLGKLDYKMLGFAPYSRIANISIANLLDPFLIKRIYPDYFLPNPYGTMKKKQTKIYDVNEVLRLSLNPIYYELESLLGVAREKEETDGTID